MSDAQHTRNDASAQPPERKRYLILVILKGGLGILLLILGGLGANNTRGQTGTFGPPYFAGAFIVGCAFIVAAFINFFVYGHVLSEQGIASHRKVQTYVFGEIAVTAVAILGGFIGIFFVSIFGVPECDPHDFFSHCNYNKNISENRSIAIAILIFLLVSEFVGLGSIVVQCRTCRGQERYNPYRSGGSQGFALQHQTYTTAGVGVPSGVAIPATYITTASPEHHHRGRYDHYSRDEQVIIDGQVVSQGSGGFQGAIISHPQTTVIHPPVGYPQYAGQPGQASSGYGAQAPPSTNSVNDLQEQNRLLREQIALQQQQLLVMQQHQQPERAPSPNLVPPPSYESCMQDPAQIARLQEQNKELQDRYQNQQHRLEKMLPSSDPNVQPSAPPM